MPWTYTGDPASSDKDKYRFLMGDTIQSQPVLQDEEITYLITTYTDENQRLYHLFDKAADVFGRAVKRSLGPQSEDPTPRLQYFADKAAYYKRIAMASGLSLPKSTCAIFTKGMHDNV